MRLNKFIAHATGKSRREADDLIAAGRVSVDGAVAKIGEQIDEESSKILLNNLQIKLPNQRTVIMLNKPVGYVSSRRAQAKDARTLYELLPANLKHLKTVGRLDKDSSGLILLTDDGDLAFSMTHPKFAKTKIYLVKLDKPLAPLHQQMISDFGVDLPDGKSQMTLERMPRDSEHSREASEKERSFDFAQDDTDRTCWRVTMHEGRNRQIRRTFAALGYTVIELHRTNFGKYELGNLKIGKWRVLK